MLPAQSTMGLGSGNIDAARSDAEIQVKNRVAEQVQTEVGLLQERSIKCSVMSLEKKWVAQV